MLLFCTKLPTFLRSVLVETLDTLQGQPHVLTSRINFNNMEFGKNNLNISFEPVTVFGCEQYAQIFPKRS